MEKSDQLAACPIERLFVKELYARTGSLTKLAFYIIRAESNMMDSTRRIFLKIFCNRTFRAGWL